MPHRYTPEQRAWLAENYPTMTNAEVCGAFYARFDVRLTRSQINCYGTNHHLRKAAGVRERALRTYTDAENEWLRGFIPGHEEQEIIAAFRERFGRTLTRAQVSNRKVELGVPSGTHGGRFVEGQEPPNKGRTWDEYMSPEGQERSRATTFHAGHTPHNAYHELLDKREDEEVTIDGRTTRREQVRVERKVMVRRMMEDGLMTDAQKIAALKALEKEDESNE